jgi:hypothetical protein
LEIYRVCLKKNESRCISDTAEHAAAGTTGEAGGAAGGEARSTEAQTNTRGSNISLDPSCRVKIPEKGSLDVDLKLFSKVQVDSK